MKKSRSCRLGLLAIFLVLIIASCEIFGLFDDEFLEETIIPEYAWQLYGNKLVFSPDGYAGLSSVDYTFINDDDVVGNNSDNVSYSGITWNIDIIDENSTLLTFNYESGGLEEYTLYNKYAPEGYSKQYYYEYKGYSGYNTYTYDGSWDYPDNGLQSDEALIMLYVESTTWDSITLTVNGEQKTRMTYFPEVFIEKVPIHTDLDIDLDLSATGDSSHYDFQCRIDSFGWYSVMKNNTITYYPGNSLVE